MNDSLVKMPANPRPPFRPARTLADGKDKPDLPIWRVESEQKHQHVE
jgi:hypothetical protein